MHISRNHGKRFKIFADFDGTISSTDVGEAMFLKFGEPARAYEIVDMWIKEEINSVQSWQMLCETIKNFNESDFTQFLNSIEIDNTFKKFESYCSNNNFDLFVLSDGLDYYIKNILKRYKLDHLTVFSNHLEFDEKKNLIPVFPYTDEECKHCANCKRNHIINNSSDDDFTVYIGDGYSDVCPVQYCDFIFAKDSLLKYCEINRVSYFPYSNFDDVISRLDDLKIKKRLKKRHQAELRRKNVYTQG